MDTILFSTSLIMIMFEVLILFNRGLLVDISKGLRNMAKEVRVVAKRVKTESKVAHDSELNTKIETDRNSKRAGMDMLGIFSKHKDSLVKSLCFLTLVLVYFMYCLSLLFTRMWYYGIGLILLTKISQLLPQKLFKNKKIRNRTIRISSASISIMIMLTVALKLRGII